MDLSVKELAAFIGVNVDTIRRTVRKGKISATRIGTALRFEPHASRLERHPANSDHCADMAKIMEMEVLDRCDVG